MDFCIVQGKIHIVQGEVHIVQGEVHIVQGEVHIVQGDYRSIKKVISLRNISKVFSHFHTLVVCVLPKV